MNTYSILNSNATLTYSIGATDGFQSLVNFFLHPYFIGIFGVTFFVGVVIFASIMQDKENKEKLTVINYDFIKAIKKTIEESLARHPDLPAKTKITGTNDKRPTAFGRIYNETIDIILPIETPSQKGYTGTGAAIYNSSLTKAKLTVSGTIADYKIELKDQENNDHLIYSSLTGKIAESIASQS